MRWLAVGLDARQMRAWEMLSNGNEGCGKLSVFSDVCEVGYSDVVAEGFEVEFSSLGGSVVAG